MPKEVVPIAMMAFIRPDLLQRVMDQLAKRAPPLLYVISDGPRNEEEEILCKKSRDIALNPTWDCEVVTFFSDENRGIVDRFTKGLDFVFQDHDTVIYLEDDILLSSSFYDFATEMLEHYRDEPRVGHVNATNLIANFTNTHPNSYLFSNHPLIWGFATWKRMWKTYDISMPKWAEVDQNAMLRRHCFSQRERKDVRKMFNLHCGNTDPWSCDYQWIFNCLQREAFAVTPTKNLSLNIGFAREDSCHTKGENPFANELDELIFPLRHPAKIARNTAFDRKLSSVTAPSQTRIIAGKTIGRIRRLFV